MNALTLLIHGESKTGKTTLAASAPAPRLILDAELKGQYLPGRKVTWNARTSPPPEVGDWETCIVPVREYADFVSAIEWLQSGKHCFRSVALDSISELQKRCQDQLNPSLDQLRTQDWGTLLRHMEARVRQLRDLTEHPTTPVETVVITAMTVMRDEKWRPYVQGQLSVTLPYFCAVVGYLFVQDIPSEDPSQPATKLRRLLVSPSASIEAGENVQGRLGLVVDDPTVPKMLKMVFPDD
jgi:hypothetical protein